jgi:hypothetical protein
MLLLFPDKGRRHTIFWRAHKLAFQTRLYINSPKSVVDLSLPSNSRNKILNTSIQLRYFDSITTKKFSFVQGRTGHCGNAAISTRIFEAFFKNPRFVAFLKWIEAFFKYFDSFWRHIQKNLGFFSSMWQIFKDCEAFKRHFYWNWGFFKVMSSFSKNSRLFYNI